MPRLRVAIQAHPLREKIALELADRADAEEVVWDDAHEDAVRCPWRNYRNALERVGGASHLAILQDDVLVCDGFRPALEAAVAAQPDRVILLFVGGEPHEYRDRVLEACAVDRPWVLLDVNRWVPVVATVWPARLIGPMLEFVDRQGWPPGFCSDDEIAGRFLNFAHEQILATVPSLAQHPDDVPSLIGDRRNWAGADPARVAACFIGDCDPATIDWSVTPL